MALRTIRTEGDSGTEKDLQTGRKNGQSVQRIW